MEAVKRNGETTTSRLREAEGRELYWRRRKRAPTTTIYVLPEGEGLDPHVGSLPQHTPVGPNPKAETMTPFRLS
jgi:hypothetical protein